MEFTQSDKLADVCYDVRGPVLDEATRLEAAGSRILKLNIGNPAPFGFSAPPEVLEAVVANLADAQGYSDSKGLLAAREAVVRYHLRKGVTGIDPGGVYLGNGVSELIMMSLQALLNNGDEVLLPAPDYPLWTAVVSLCGGRPVHYLCDESAGWAPDLDDIAAKVTPRTRAIVVINPNNPTGAVYDRQVLENIVEVARRHHLMLLSDEIYDRILYEDAEHIATAALAPDLVCMTFNGLSKSYRLAGFRAGWMVMSGPRGHASSYIEGVNILANMRLCANAPGQFATVAALTEDGGAGDLVLPGGRLREQRDTVVKLLNDIPGVSCVPPRGALYAFPRLDPAVYPIRDDERFVLDLLLAEKILLVQGSGFNWPHPDHVRIVTLPAVDDLTDAIGRIDRFLASYKRPSQQQCPSQRRN
ncbi:aminotransferase [Frankia sp. CcI156]|jgi:alanine-synthesizing transaminase|uniref:alanine transaminase n=2 Tax=Frankia casuarinae (strain DSM 45818 / CECT 9043 / HFP020203 / CcI3) TaxID=106370 RepID=Q2JGY4_FRACC|nr:MULTISPECIES: pyridoxal phosphate-dependent aminotransferase [Frankia]ABD09458.1 aminotransferase [Frankia casuarinae]EYT94139.1 aspartate/tyrosine/aromatic aminotransferase [Frankia casuarinae]KDA44329.1 aspartate/tyrosine/aromatic aminotransferase [Frankia sp. BMG5.23]KEZ35865.1 aspartate/tyrosine/aromatic aminotransferase [Frankia sp. CeD]OHV52278.1 aminotransferase [Frankia sp. CgIS1]